jgi:hypothetical protein
MTPPFAFQVESESQLRAEAEARAEAAANALKQHVMEAAETQRRLEVQLQATTLESVTKVRAYL